MIPPYWRCMACGVDVEQTRFPLRGGDRVPVCPRCGSVEYIDVVLGDENMEYDADMVIYVDEEE